MIDTVAWSLEPIATTSGVELVISIPAWSRDSAALSLTREEARTFARAVLAAAGDGIERTFTPKAPPSPREGRHG